MNNIPAVRLLVLVVANFVSTSALADRPLYPANLGNVGYAADKVWKVSETGELLGSSRPTLPAGIRASYWTQDAGLRNLGVLGVSYYSEGRWLTDDGMVVGWSGEGSNVIPFYWTEIDGMVEIPLTHGVRSQVRDVNSSSGGVAANTCDNTSGNCQSPWGYFWTKEGGTVDIGTQQNSCVPRDINSSDQVVGRCGSEAFIWSPSTGLQFIDVGGTEFNCFANSINDSGLVTGGCSSGSAFAWSTAAGVMTWSYPGSPVTQGTRATSSGLVVGITTDGRAFTWTQSGGLVALTTDGSVGESIMASSDSGHVFLELTFYDGNTGVYSYKDYVWSESAGFEALIINGHERVVITGVNDHGAAVGRDNVTGGVPDFLWTPDAGFRPLNQLVGHVRNDAHVISNRGQIGGLSCLTGSSGCVFALWNSEPLSSGLLPLALSDLNGNGSEDIAVAMPGSVQVHIRDGASKTLIGNINFGSDPAIAIEKIADLNSNGADEIALLGTRPSGQVRVQVRDSATGELLASLFYGTVYAGVDMAVLPDSNGNGAPEIVVLGKNSAGAVRARALDVLSGDATMTSYFGTTVEPVSVEVLADISGNGKPEIAMLGTVIASDQARLQLRDSGDGAFIKNLYFGTAYSPMQILEIDDISGDGKPDIVELGLDNSTGAVRIQAKSTASGATVFNAYTGSTDYPVQILAIGDRNSDTVDEVALLVQRPGGSAKVIIRDGANGAFVSNVFLGAIDQPVGMALVSDLDNSGDPEFVVLGEDINKVLVQIKDTINGAQVRNIEF